jgi:hypothetical protein
LDVGGGGVGVLEESADHGGEEVVAEGVGGTGGGLEGVVCVVCGAAFVVLPHDFEGFC